MKIIHTGYIRCSCFMARWKHWNFFVSNKKFFFVKKKKKTSIEKAIYFVTFITTFSQHEATDFIILNLPDVFSFYQFCVNLDCKNIIEQDCGFYTQEAFCRHSKNKNNKVFNLSRARLFSLVQTSTPICINF